MSAPRESSGPMSQKGPMSNTAVASGPMSNYTHEEEEVC